MSFTRHSDESRVTSATPPELRLTVERLRRRATRRKLVLLECGIIRHAPFAECGRPLWELMREKPWFEMRVSAPERLKLIDALYASAGKPPWDEKFEARSRTLAEIDPSTGEEWTWSRMNGHEAVEWLERHVDGAADEDQLLVAKHYLQGTEYLAEASRFDPPEDQREASRLSYGPAYWLRGLADYTDYRNVIDHYLANFPGTYDCWASHLPYHPDHRTVAVKLIEDIFGPPLRLPALLPRWRTADVIGVARSIYDNRAFDRLPLLSDALLDADCDDESIIAHCRSAGLHVRGCWVVDLAMGLG